MSEEAIVRVVDDDPAIRKSLAWLVESVGLNVETYASAQVFLDAYDSKIPGCVVLDIRMPGMSGLDLLDKLRERKADIPVIVVTGFGDVPIAVRAMKSGAVEFLEKPVGEQQLLDHIHQAISQDVENHRNRAAQLAIVERIKQLTRRERQVMKLVVAGKSTKGIAAELGVKVKTVEAHRAGMMKKMEAKSVAELIHMNHLASSEEP
jgi:FixJ family two-component response regulator